MLVQGASKQRRLVAMGALGAGALILLASAGLAAVSFVAADRLVHPARDTSPLTPDSRGLAYADVKFLATDGVPLAAWWMPASAAAGTVVFLHGYGASKAQALSVAPFLHAAGYNVLAFDFRAHGASGGDHTTVGVDEVNDVEGAVRWLTERGDLDPARIALFGWSMGAATAINAAPGLPHVRAIVADSAFASLSSVGARTFARETRLPESPVGVLSLLFASWMTGTTPAQDEPVRAVAQAHRPIFLIQGLADALVLPDDARDLSAAAGDHAQLWLVPDAPHVDAHRYHPGEYESRVLAFLGAAFSQAS